MASQSTSGLRALAIALALAFLVASASAGSSPSNKEIKAELSNMAANISKYFKAYANHANRATKAISYALRTSYDFSALKDGTILFANDATTAEFNKVVPASKKNAPTLYNVTAYHIIAQRYTYDELKAMKPGPFPTQLKKKQPIYKMTKAGASRVSFGKGKGFKPNTWTTIKDPAMYTGPYFIVHGVDKLEIPVGTSTNETM